ncbi:hypothetical protein OAW_01825 [Vibrio cyclitrophicus ZF170]|uniref:hypothetical protein n=1 Tax=Vibrio cyclitrophicus TaxID=47951 RepID=UPI0002D5A815|nr:hypothetical protein [Vibrio cyclitrophicus]OBT04368.1 hypothetical protein A9265_17460 [Vibrio cyclitrophicus]OEE23116.1 hypothetical protein OAW_01825 [Vibrio cyclitrophicus ZF170]
MTISQESKLIKMLLVFTLFIFTLQNHGNIRLILTIVPLSLFFLYLIFVSCDKKSVLGVLKLVLIVCIFSFMSYFSLLTYKNNMGDYTSFEFFIGMMFKIIILFLFINVMARNKPLFVFVIEYVLFIHVVFFFIQFFLVYSTNFYIDALEPFTGEFSRYTWGVRLPIIGETYRPTGFFNEPSTYLSVIFPLFCLKFFIDGNITRVDKAMLLSLVLSLSFASIGVVLLFLIAINIKFNRFYKYLPLIMILLLVSMPFIYDLLSMRSSGNYDAVGIRAELVNRVFGQSFLEVLFGNGPAGIPSSLADLYSSSLSWTKEGVAALNDGGLGLLIVMQYGLITLLFFVVYIGYNSNSINKTICFSLILVTKIKIAGLVFIFIVLSLIIFGGKEKHEV